MQGESAAATTHKPAEVVITITYDDSKRVWKLTGFHGDATKDTMDILEILQWGLTKYNVCRDTKIWLK